MDYSDLVAAAQPDEMRASLEAHADDLRAAADAHAGHPAASVRRFTHDGHRVEIRTTYEITIDGEPFETPMTVDLAGRVHYHGLPTQDFASMVDLVKRVIDQFPDDGPPPGGDEGDEGDEPGRPGGHGPHDHGEE